MTAPPEQRVRVAKVPPKQTPASEGSRTPHPKHKPTELDNYIWQQMKVQYPRFTKGTPDEY